MIATENDYDSRTALRFLEQKIGRLGKIQRQHLVRNIHRLIDAIVDECDQEAAMWLATVLDTVDMHVKARIGKLIEVDDEESA